MNNNSSICRGKRQADVYSVLRKRLERIDEAATIIRANAAHGELAKVAEDILEVAQSIENTVRRLDLGGIEFGLQIAREQFLLTLPSRLARIGEELDILRFSHSSGVCDDTKESLACTVYQMAKEAEELGFGSMCRRAQAMLTFLHASPLRPGASEEDRAEALVRAYNRLSWVIAREAGKPGA